MTDLAFEDVTIRYGRRRSDFAAVEGVTLTVPSGSTVGLVGESGSGKSTLGRAAVGLVPVAEGHIRVGDEVLGTRRPRESRVQMVFQDPSASLDPRRTVGQSIADSIRGRTRSVGRQARVDELLRLVRLDPERADDYPDQLSGGQRQRIALARALAGDPEVVIADEITSALDVSVQGAVLNLVRDLQRELGLTMLFISHNLAVVRYVSDYIAVMYLGRIVEFGPAQGVLSAPQHPYTRTLLAAVPDPSSPLLDRPSDAALARVADAEPADPHLPPSGCRFHPRCPVGPLVRDDRGICVESDPTAGQSQRINIAACHFADHLPIPQQRS